VSTNDLRLGLLRQPRAVYFGPGQRAQLPNIVATLGRNALICTDERMATTTEFADIVSALEDRGITTTVFSRVEPDVPRENIMALVSDLTGDAFDAIIGLGGGSCMDFAKVASIMLVRGGDVRDLYGENLIETVGIPVITVPTTGGTGAEVTCIAVVFDAQKSMKVGVASPYLEAYAAVVDPELTLSCPPGLTAATGADALTHLVEAFTARAKNPSPEDINQHLYVGKNVLADIYARAGLSLLNASLERVVVEPSNLAARSDTMLGALNAGMAINTAGTAAAHAIQSPIGALTHTAHGIGVGTLLPYVMRYNLAQRVDEFAEIGRIFGVADQLADPLKQAQTAIERIEYLLSALGVPQNLRELGLLPEQFNFVADQAMLATRLTANNPRQLSKDSIVGILRKGYDDDRSWWQL